MNFDKKSILIFASRIQTPYSEQYSKTLCESLKPSNCQPNVGMSNVRTQMDRKNLLFIKDIIVHKIRETHNTSKH